MIFSEKARKFEKFDVFAKHVIIFAITERIWWLSRKFSRKWKHTADSCDFCIFVPWDQHRLIKSMSKLTLSKKSLYACKQHLNKIRKHFLPQSLSGVSLYFQISPQMFFNISKWPNWTTQGPGGNWFMEKSMKSKISCQTPFNFFYSKIADYVSCLHKKITFHTTFGNEQCLNTCLEFATPKRGAISLISFAVFWPILWRQYVPYCTSSHNHAAQYDNTLVTAAQLDNLIIFDMFYLPNHLCMIWAYIHLSALVQY